MNKKKIDIDQLGSLAKLNIRTNSNLSKELLQTTKWLTKLQEIDTTEVEPVINMAHLINQWSEDQPEDPIPHNRALYNAPEKDSNYFHVPEVQKKETN